MAAFKHHTYFQNPRKAEVYLFPHVCLNCKKSFKKAASLSPRVCPECKGELVQLSRKFKAPRARGARQWAKIRLLVEHGFSFYSVYERTAYGEISVPYPRTLEEAWEFVKGKKREATNRSRVPDEMTYRLTELPIVKRRASAPVTLEVNIEVQHR